MLTAQLVIVIFAVVVVATLVIVGYRLSRKGGDRRSRVLAELHDRDVEVGVVRSRRSGLVAVRGRLDSSGLRHGFVRVGSGQVRVARISYLIAGDDQWTF